MKKFHFICPSCNRRYFINIYSGDFADLYEMRCTKCSRTLLINQASDDFSKVFGRFGKNYTKEFDTELSQNLTECPCGGRFSAYASYRCPHCNFSIHIDEIKKQIKWWGSDDGIPGVIMGERMISRNIWNKK